MAINLPSPNSSRSIAVLPFVNLSSDPDQEYFSDGITEEIINALAQIEGLKVISRTSSFAFKAKPLDVREIGQQLGVKNILEGSVRKARNRVRITAQLINVEDGMHLWSETFDRKLEDIFALEDEISLLIAHKIREHFGHFEIQDHLVQQPTAQVQAFELYLKGRFYQLQWTPESLEKAITCYDEAVAVDPGFARAYYANLQCYGVLATWGFMPHEAGYAKAMENFWKGKALNTDLPEYHMSLVGRSLWSEWDFQEAHHHLRQALALNPSYDDALEGMTELLMANGYFEEAERYLRKALEVSPLSANHHFTLGQLFYFLQNYQSALSHLDRAAELKPDLELAHEVRLLCLIWLNQQDSFEKMLLNLPAGKAQMRRQLFQAINQEPTTLDDAEVAKLTGAATAAQFIPWELYLLAHSNHTQAAWEALKLLVAEKRGSIINFRYEPLLQSLTEIYSFDELEMPRLVLPTVQEAEAPRSSQPDSAELKRMKQRMTDFLEKERPYLDPQLSLSGLAESIRLHPNKLSYLINTLFGRNFNEVINQYRLEHFKRIAETDKVGQLTILGMAYESGFNSKTVFNTFFKKQEGMTPKAWLRQQEGI